MHYLDSHFTHCFSSNELNAFCTLYILWLNICIEYVSCFLLGFHCHTIKKFFALKACLLIPNCIRVHDNAFFLTAGTSPLCYGIWLVLCCFLVWCTSVACLKHNVFLVSAVTQYTSFKCMPFWQGLRWKLSLQQDRKTPIVLNCCKLNLQYAQLFNTRNTYF